MWVSLSSLDNPAFLDSLRAADALDLAARLDQARVADSIARVARLQAAESERAEQSRKAEVLRQQGIRRDSAALADSLRALTRARLLAASDSIHERSVGRDSIAFSRRISRSPIGKWTRTNGKSEMDDSPVVVLRLRSENVATGWLSRNRTTLVVRCREGNTEVYVVTGMAANPELGAYQQATVRTRLDADPPQTETWGEATSNDALFAQDGVLFAMALARSRTFRFEFTPFNASPVIVTFDVLGLERQLPAVARACNWPTNQRRALFVGERATH
jgi:hypothetical protein